MIRDLLLVVAATATIVLGPSAALAVDGSGALIDASPGPDAVVVRPPEEIALSFRDPVASVHVRIFKGGDIASSSESVVEDSLAIAPVELDGPGSYLVDWKGTDAAGAAISGAYVFVVDPRGDNSIAVGREITGASGALGGLRVIAAAVAAGGVVALVGAGGRWSRREGSVLPGRGITAATLVTALASLVAAATYGVPADGSPIDLFDPATISSAIASWPGRAWLTAALVMGVMPFVVVVGRSARSHGLAIGTTVLTAVAALWIAVGLAWLMRLPWPLTYTALVAAAALWLSIDRGRPIAAGIALVALIAVAVPVVSGIRGAGTSSAVQTGGLLIEVSLDPARSGINELHVYGFEVSGRGTALGPTSVVAYHQEMDVGPLELPVLRAGPNHFLSYRAMLPLPGDWTLDLAATTPEGGVEHAVIEMRLR
jgi:methionine-rich copper-binding protein CopC